jgi:fructose-bisphosphate aldolase class II
MKRLTIFKKIILQKEENAMPIMPLRPLLESCIANGYAQGAYNMNSVHQIKAAIEIHEILRSPLIIQGADFANGFMGGRCDFLNSTLEDKAIGAKRIVEAVKKYGENSPIPIVIHLDHGKDFDSVKVAIDAGYTSVMIDGSHLDFEENIALTKKVVDYAHERGVTVEGELGVLAGVEDNVFSSESTYTNPMKVVEFFKKTGVDALAISYGTMHGANKGKNVKLRKEIAIASMENLRHEGIFGALVSHGSSTVPKYIVDEVNQYGGDIQDTGGISVEEIKKVIPCGIAKINVDTDIRLAITRNIREYFHNNPEKKEVDYLKEIYAILKERSTGFDPRGYLTPIMDTMTKGIIPTDDVKDIVELMEKGVKEILSNLSVHFGSVGYAPKVEKLTLEDMKNKYRQGHTVC